MTQQKNREPQRFAPALLASFFLTATLGTWAGQPDNHHNAQHSPLAFALQALQEACLPYTSAAQQSLEAADLALYCLSTGESIVLQVAQNPHEKKFAQSTIAHWIEQLHPTLAQHRAR